MVVIDLSADDDPNVIFETMNARGTPLEQSDLIKNYVLSRSSNELDGKIDLWEGLDENWCGTRSGKGDSTDRVWICC